MNAIGMDPWHIISMVMRESAADGVKTSWGGHDGSNLGEAAQHAAAMLEALGIPVHIPADV